MKSFINQFFNVMIYFFTPEDSSTRAKNGIISFKFDSSMFDLGSLKALFWVMNAMILICLISMLT